MTPKPGALFNMTTSVLSNIPPSSNVEFKFEPSFLAISSPPGRNIDMQSPEHPLTEVCVTNCDTLRRLDIHALKYMHITEVGTKVRTPISIGANPAKVGSVLFVGMKRFSKFALPAYLVFFMLDYEVNITNFSE